MERAGAAGFHIEDQVQAKRCGHRPGKQIVSTEEMVDRIKACVAARRDPNFVIMARTDAFANEGIDKYVLVVLFLFSGNTSSHFRLKRNF